MGKKKKRKAEFKIEILVWGDKTDSRQVYPWNQILREKIRYDQRFYPIIGALENIKFPVPVEIILGEYIFDPLFINIAKVTNQTFSEEIDEQGFSLGFQLFGGDNRSFKKANAGNIQKEFKNKFLEFLSQRRKRETRIIMGYEKLLRNSLKMKNESRN